MSAIDDVLAKIKPPTASVRVCLRGDLLGDLDLINEDLAQFAGWVPTSLSDPTPRAELLAAKAELETQMRAESATFRFQNIGDEAWSDLNAAHPPREGRENKENFNAATFPTALISAAATDPTMTVDQTKTLLNGFTLTQRNQIFASAYAANVRSVDVPFLPPAFDKAQSTGKKSK